MNDLFNEIFNDSFDAHDLLLRSRSILNNENYFKVRHFKAQRFQQLSSIYSPTTSKKKNIEILIGSNFVTENWDAIELINIPGIKFSKLDPNFFLDSPTPSEFNERCLFLKNKFVITTNHDIVKNNPITLRNFLNYFLNCGETVFAGWDWDNHHNSQISSIYALCSDIYLPSQRANDYEFSRVAPRYKFIAPSAYEWSTTFLDNNINHIINSDRSSDIFGVFNFYERFPYRNQTIATINKSIPQVKFIDDYSNYLSKNIHEKLAEWISFKWHWLVPTYSAVSVRAFYSLIAGTGVILPIEYYSYEEFNDLDERDVIWYDDTDIINPNRVMELANSKFNTDLKNGILRRHEFAKNKHNLNNRFTQIYETICSFLDNRN